MGHLYWKCNPLSFKKLKQTCFIINLSKSRQLSLRIEPPSERLLWIESGLSDEFLQAFSITAEQSQNYMTILIISWHGMSGDGRLGCQAPTADTWSGRGDFYF